MHILIYIIHIHIYILYFIIFIVLGKANFSCMLVKLYSHLAMTLSPYYGWMNLHTFVNYDDFYHLQNLPVYVIVFYLANPVLFF